MSSIISLLFSSKAWNLNLSLFLFTAFPISFMVSSVQFALGLPTRLLLCTHFLSLLFSNETLCMECTPLCRVMKMFGVFLREGIPFCKGHENVWGLFAGVYATLQGHENVWCISFMSILIYTSIFVYKAQWEYISEWVLVLVYRYVHSYASIYQYTSTII